MKCVQLSGVAHSATLADGTFPGPIIAGTKVTFNSQEDTTILVLTHFYTGFRVLNKRD